MTAPSPISTIHRAQTNFIVILGSFTTPEQDIGVAELDATDRLSGKFGCGYHYVIRRDGTVEHGRDEDRIGAHCGVYNPVSLQICMVGGKGEDGKWCNNYTEEQHDSLEGFLKLLLSFIPRAQIAKYHELAGVKSKSPGF